MHSGKNPYEILGLAEDATQEQIMKAYKLQALKKHPDKGGNTQEFQELQDAYEQLVGRRDKQFQAEQYATPTINEFTPLMEMIKKGGFTKDDFNSLLNTIVQSPPADFSQAIKRIQVISRLDYSLQKNVVPEKCMVDAIAACNNLNKDELAELTVTLSNTFNMGNRITFPILSELENKGITHIIVPGITPAQLLLTPDELKKVVNFTALNTSDKKDFFAVACESVAKDKLPLSIFDKNFRRLFSQDKGELNRLLKIAVNSNVDNFDRKQSFGRSISSLMTLFKPSTLQNINKKTDAHLRRMLDNIETKPAHADYDKWVANVIALTAAKICLANKTPENIALLDKVLADNTGSTTKSLASDVKKLLANDEPSPTFRNRS